MEGDMIISKFTECCMNLRLLHGMTTCLHLVLIHDYYFELISNVMVWMAIKWSILRLSKKSLMIFEE